MRTVRKLRGRHLGSQETPAREKSCKEDYVLNEDTMVLEMASFTSLPQEGEGMNAILDAGSIIPLRTRFVLVS